ncbi:HIT-like protein [Clavulina sp. PMI_390]|nr:HIT-like protein [Clavulina sp. PMI_390]
MVTPASCHLSRSPHMSAPESDGACEFCNIAHGNAPAHVIFESRYVIAFLDILPSRRGHVLIVPKDHYPLLSQLPDDMAREMGSALALVSRAMTEALGNEAFTVTLNQVYAQIIPHVHFHVVPAPDFRAGSLSKLKPFAPRQELDDEDAEVLVREIKARL